MGIPVVEKKEVLPVFDTGNLIYLFIYLFIFFFFFFLPTAEIIAQLEGEIGVNLPAV